MYVKSIFKYLTCAIWGNLWQLKSIKAKSPKPRGIEGLLWIKGRPAGSVGSCLCTVELWRRRPRCVRKVTQQMLHLQLEERVLKPYRVLRINILYYNVQAQYKEYVHPLECSVRMCLHVTFQTIFTDERLKADGAMEELFFTLDRTNIFSFLHQHHLHGGTKNLAQCNTRIY